MKTILKTAIAATALAGAALLASAPAQAGISFNLSIGVPNAIAFDYGSGGYCDDYGCPDGYWDMPVYYGPVYYGGGWYKGPIYYRDFGGDRWYWIHNGWRRDEWRGPRPKWWKGNYRVGPALGYDFYRANGFRHDRDRYWRGNDWRPGKDWDRNRWKDKNGAWNRPGDRDKDNRPGGGMNGPGGGKPGGGSMTGPGGGGMTGPGGGKPGGGSMTGPGGGGSMTGPGGSKGDSGSMTGPNGGGNSTGDKPKHKPKGGDSSGGGN
jgi:hypothetical protein